MDVSHDRDGEYESAHEGNPLQRTWPAHTVVVDFDGGWPTARMFCPFDKADATRPCWPWWEDKPCDQGEGESTGCNWGAWFSEGGLDCVQSGVVVLDVIKAVWDDDCYRFDLARHTLPQPPSSGRTDG